MSSKFTIIEEAPEAKRKNNRIYPFIFDYSHTQVSVQADLKDSEGLVLDHCNKVNITIKSVTYFLVSSAYKGYVYAML